MMSPFAIRDQRDWWAAAAVLSTMIDDYLSMFANPDAFFSNEKAKELQKAKNHSELHSMYEHLWACLPDDPRIRQPAFFILCDLCSEYGVFQEGA